MRSCETTCKGPHFVPGGRANWNPAIPQTAEIVHNALVSAVRSKKMAMVVTSHWPKAINSLADKAIWLESGEMLKIGAPKDVTTEFMVGFEPKQEEHVELGMTMVKVQDVKKYYYSINRGVVKAVDGVSLEIGERSSVSLV